MGESLWLLTPWSVGDVAVISNAIFSNSLYRIVAWALAVKCSQVNATELHQWEVNIGLVPSGSKPFPEHYWPKFCRHRVWLGHNELMWINGLNWGITLMINALILLVRKPKYSTKTRSIPWLLMPLLFAGPGGCFTKVSRALQNNLAKIHNARNHHYGENFKLKLCTCAQSIALGSRTKFQLEILIKSTISVIHKFRENILESSRNLSETTPRPSVAIYKINRSLIYIMLWF